MSRFPIRLLTLTLILLAAASTAYGKDTAPPAAPLTGSLLRDLPAPDFQLSTLTGESVSPQRYTGWIQVLHFFDGDSDETERMLKEMAFFHSQGRELEIAFLGVSSQPESSYAYKKGWLRLDRMKKTFRQG